MYFIRVCPYVFFLFCCYYSYAFNRNVQQIGVNIMKITEQKNGNYTTFERIAYNGYYIVKLYKRGELADKIMADTYKGAREYLKSFNLLAKNS